MKEGREKGKKERIKEGSVYNVRSIGAMMKVKSGPDCVVRMRSS